MEEPVSFSILVPEGAAAGTPLPAVTPDGKQLDLTVPPGVPPGSRLVLTQDPVTKKWGCHAELPESPPDPVVEAAPPPAPAAPLSFTVVVPAGASAGSSLPCKTPSGQDLDLTVPAGVPPGSVLTLTQDPSTKKWKCEAELPEPAAQASEPEVPPAPAAVDTPSPAAAPQAFGPEPSVASGTAVAEPLRVSVVVPEGATPGMKLQQATPDGQELDLIVPPGLPPGSLLVLTQDPSTKKWSCSAELREEEPPQAAAPAAADQRASCEAPAAVVSAPPCPPPPEPLMEPAVVEPPASPLTITFTVPEGAAGTMLQHKTPDGQDLDLNVPEGLPPGSLLIMTQDPVTKEWSCEAELPQPAADSPAAEWGGGAPCQPSPGVAAVHASGVPALSPSPVQEATEALLSVPLPQAAVTASPERSPADPAPSVGMNPSDFKPDAPRWDWTVEPAAPPSQDAGRTAGAAPPILFHNVVAAAAVGGGLQPTGRSGGAGGSGLSLVIPAADMLDAPAGDGQKPGTPTWGCDMDFPEADLPVEGAPRLPLVGPARALPEPAANDPMPSFPAPPPPAEDPWSCTPVPAAAAHAQTSREPRKEAEGSPGRPAAAPSPAEVPPRYCCAHDTSAKRTKMVAPQFWHCTSCTIRVQTNYTDFTLCAACSDREQRCMLCGGSAPSAGAYVPSQHLAPAPAGPTPAALQTTLVGAGQEKQPSWTPPQILEDRPSFTPLPQLPLGLGQPALGTVLAEGSPIGSPGGQAPPLSSPPYDPRGGSSAFMGAARASGSPGQGPSITTMPVSEGSPQSGVPQPLPMAQAGVAMSPQMSVRGVRMPGLQPFGALPEFPPFMRPSISLPGPLGNGPMMGGPLQPNGHPVGGMVHSIGSVGSLGSLGTAGNMGSLGSISTMGSVGTMPGPFAPMAQNSESKGALGPGQHQPPGLMVVGGG